MARTRFLERDGFRVMRFWNHEVLKEMESVLDTIYAALHDADFPMTGGEQQRDFVYVDDVARGLIAALRAPHVEGRALDLGTGTLYRVLDVVERIWALTQSRGRIQAGALSYRPGEVSAIPANAHRTRMLTGWEAAVKLDEGLRLTIDHVAEAEHV